MKKLKNILKNKKELIYKLVLWFILIIGIFIRVIAIDKIPIGINVDEAGTAYDAYCIANYGVDRYLNHNPVYAINYGGGQSVLYTYLVAGFIKLLGFSLFAVRLPALIISIISILIFYILIKDFKNKKLGIIATFLIVIVPWHFMQSRWALDCNLMSSMLLISIFCLLKAKNKLGYIVAGIMFGITLYSYALTYIIVPVILLFLILAVRKIKISDITCMGIPIFILALPLMLNLLVNNGFIEPIKNSLFSTPKLWAYRGAEISITNIPENIWSIFKCMFGYDINDYNAFPQFGTLYYISIPLFVIGIVETVKKAKENFKKTEINIDLIFILYFFSIFISLLLVEELSISKINSIYIPMIYFVAMGINSIATKNKYIFIGTIMLYVIMFSLFQYYYFFIYGKENKNKSFNQTTIEAVQYIESNEKFDNKIINIGTTAIQPYIYTLIANQTSPYKFNESLLMNGAVYAYDRYVFYNKTINENIVYVLVKTDLKYELRDTLLEQGFISEDFKNLEILYKTIEQ